MITLHHQPSQSPNASCHDANNAAAVVGDEFDDVVTQNSDYMCEDSDGVRSDEEGSNDAIDVDVTKITTGNATDEFDPLVVLRGKLSHDEKMMLIKMQPCQPSESMFSQRRKKIENKERCCSKRVFHRSDGDGDGSKRSWLAYSLHSDSLYCIPCMLFTDKTMRGEDKRANQGNAFV